jgi:hypothetical protein
MGGGLVSRQMMHAPLSAAIRLRRKILNFQVVVLLWGSPIKNSKQKGDRFQRARGDNGLAVDDMCRAFACATIRLRP